MPSTQHSNPKSDIEIAQAAVMRPISEIAAEKLGIGAEHLEPYGHYKAKISLAYIKSLGDRPDSTLIPATAPTPTPPAPAPHSGASLAPGPGIPLLGPPSRGQCGVCVCRRSRNRSTSAPATPAGRSRVTFFK